MSKKFIIIIAIIILLAPALIAAENSKPKEDVYIRPWSSEITIDLRTQEGVARMGWGTCSPGLAADWVENTVIHLELYQGLVLLQTVDTGDASWVTNSDPDADWGFSCMHAGLPQTSYWDFSRLRLRRPGDYILRFTVETTVPLTDGADFKPADGVMDLYPAQLFFDEEEVLIHVVRASPSTVTVEPTMTPKKIPLIFDDDGSRDGMAALLYLLSHPEISIEAISISYGEAHPELYIQHVGRVLDNFGVIGIPLGAGQDMPLAGGTPFPDWLRQLSDNFWDYPLPNADKTYPFQDAPELMVSVINQASEPVTIFLSGPLTNLAQALHLNPNIKNNISAVYLMGGAVDVPGNITNLIPGSNNLVAEWNIIADPQAAKEVFESGLELFMVPLDATNKVIFRQEDILPWRQGDEKANMVVDLYEIMFNDYGFESVEIFDLTAAAIMAQPELCAFQSLHLDIITDDGNYLGQTIIAPGSDPNIHVCLDPNVAQVKQNLNESFSP